MTSLEWNELNHGQMNIPIPPQPDSRRLFGHIIYIYINSTIQIVLSVFFEEIRRNRSSNTPHDYNDDPR